MHRDPTSHERMTGQPWDASYQEGPAPWDIGHPQPAIVRAAAHGRFRGDVLDAGCGTGEHALHLASLGLRVFGIDVAETAIAIARQKAAAQGASAEFAVADAFQLAALGRRFDAVLDAGLFHTFDALERRRYAESLASVTTPGATVVVLCFSDAGPDTGPHPIREGEIRSAFSAEAGWEIAAIEAECVHTRFHGASGAPAWLASITRK